MYEKIDDLPDDIQRLSPEEARLWMQTYNRVFHMTQDDLAARLAAEGALIKRHSKVALKSAREGVIGWSLMFTDADHLDFHETYFSKLTSLLLHYYERAPLWMEHGWHPDYGPWPIGQRESAKVFAHGIWMAHGLHEDHERYDETCEGVERGEFAYSSDSVGHYVDQGFNPLDGELRHWPFAGCSLTKSPAEPGLGRVTFKSFVSVMERHNDARPKTYPVIYLSSGARKALKDKVKKTAASLQLSTHVFKGMKMEPQMLADLAAFFGVEATVEAVTAALQEAINALSDTSGDGEVSGFDEASMMSALGLSENASRADMLDALQIIVEALQTDEGGADEEDEEDEERDYAALSRAARFAVEQRNHIPFKTKRPGFNINTGRAKKPGLLDVIGAISQVQGGAIQFGMPNIKSRVNPRQALRAMNINNAPSGGWMLNRQLSSELLEALYADLILEQLGARMIPMDGIESITMNRVQSGAQSYWAGSSQTVSDANAKIQAAVTLQTKELVSKAIIENRLLKNGGAGIEAMVEEDIKRVMRLRMEYSAFYGTGSVPVASGNSGAEPLGLKNITGVTQTSLASKNPGVDDLINAEGRIEDSNLDYGELAWASSKRARRYFKKMKDANGLPLFDEDWITNDVRALIVQDYPFHTTTQIPNTTSGSTVTTDIFLGAWENFLIGQGLDLEMVVDTSRYVEERSTLIQIVSYVDFGVAYKEAFQVITLAKV